MQQSETPNHYQSKMTYTHSVSCCHIIEVGGYSSFVGYVSDGELEKVVEAMTWPDGHDPRLGGMWPTPSNPGRVAGISSKSMVAYFPMNDTYKTFIKLLKEAGWKVIRMGKSNSSWGYDVCCAMHNAPTLREQQATLKKNDNAPYWSRYASKPDNIWTNKKETK